MKASKKHSKPQARGRSLHPVVRQSEFNREKWRQGILYFLNGLRGTGLSVEEIIERMGG